MRAAVCKPLKWRYHTPARTLSYRNAGLVCLAVSAVCSCGWVRVRVCKSLAAKSYTEETVCVQPVDAIMVCFSYGSGVGSV